MKMKRFILLTLLTLAAVTGMLHTLYAEEETSPLATQPTAEEVSAVGTPKIAFEKTEHDFGEMEKQQSVKHIFKFKNEGDALLVIEKVRATCGCTGTLLSQKELPAGEEGTIEVTFRAGVSGGKSQKSIYVHSNDPEQPSAQLKIKATVVVPVEVKPRSLFWVVERDKTSIRMVKLVHQPEVKLNITDLKFSSPESAFSASVSPEADAEMPTYNIEVTCDGSLPSGNFNEKLTIHTDNPDYPTMNVTLRGNVAGTVRVTPNAVALGVIKDGVIPARRIRVYAVDKDDFEITGLEPTSALIKTDMTKEENTDRYSINVTLTESPPIGAFSEKLVVKTNVPEEESIEIPVYAYIR